MLTPIVATPLASYSCLVPVGVRAPGPALFMVPGLGGTIEGLLELADLLDLPIQVYAIQAVGVDGQEAPDQDVGVMAERYLAEVKRLQPSGPYWICGHSFGGVVAFEMASRLCQGGETIAALILLDTPIHQSFWPRAYFVQVMAGRFRHHVAAVRRMPAGDAAAYLYRTSRFMVTKLLGRFGRIDLPISEEDDLTPALQAVVDAGRVALAGYRPPFFPGSLIYLAAQLPGPVTLDPEVIWRPRAAALHVASTPGGHLSMLEPPHVSGLAAALRRCLVEASPELDRLTAR